MITLDAKNQKLGRLATEVARYILGKHKPNFVWYKITGEKVEVTNIDKIKITGNKMEQKIYYKHTGYTGHLREKKMKEFPRSELLKMAVWNMLPKNKLRKERIKLLIIR